MPVPAPRHPALAAADDPVAAIAARLISHGGTQVPLAGLARGDDGEPLHDAHDALHRLDKLGLVLVCHRLGRSTVAVLHRAGLRRLAAGESLEVVAASVEPTRPLTVIRVAPDRWAAWYRSTLRLPQAADLGRADAGAAIGRTADEAVAELQRRARSALIFSHAGGS